MWFKNRASHYIFRSLFKLSQPTGRTMSRHCLVFSFSNNTSSLKAVSYTGSVFVLMLLDYKLQTNIKHISTEIANSLLPVAQKLTGSVPPSAGLSPLWGLAVLLTDSHLPLTVHTFNLRQWNFLYFIHLKSNQCGLNFQTPFENQLPYR